MPKFVFTVAAFAISAICFTAYLISTSRQPLPLLLFWASFLSGLTIVLAQIFSYKMTFRRGLVILIEIITLSFLAQLIFVIPVRAGVFGRDAFFDLYSMQTIYSTGWPVPKDVYLSQVTRLVSDWPLMQFLGLVISDLVRIDLFSVDDPYNVVRLLPSILSMGVAPSVYSITRRLFGSFKYALLAALSTSLTITNTMFHTWFVRETLAYVLLFGFILAYILSEQGEKMRLRGRALCILLLIGLAFAHHLTFVFTLVFLTVVISVRSGLNAFSRIRRANNNPRVEWGIGQPFILLTLAASVFLTYLLYIGQPIFQTLVQTIADLARPQLAYSAPLGGGFTRARFLLLSRLAFGAFFAVMILRRIVSRIADPFWYLVGFLWGGASGLLGAASVFVEKTANITLFRLEGFAWPLVIIPAMPALALSKVRLTTPLVVALFVVANMASIPQYQYDPGASPLYQQGETSLRYDATLFAAVDWFRWGGRMVGDDTTEQAFIGLRQANMTNDYRIYEGDLQNISQYEWIVLRHEDSLLVPASSVTNKLIIVTPEILDSFNRNPQLSKVYTNGDVDLYSVS